MLSVLRQNSQSFIVYLIFLPIIVVFAVTFGPGSSSCGEAAGGQYAATVDGEVIRQQDFTMTYNRRLEMLRQQMRGMELTNEMAESMGLRKQVIDQLISEKLLSREAARWDLVVSDDELIEQLESVYGVKDVDYATYVNWVRNRFQMPVSQFEEEVRRELLGQKLARVLTDNVAVSSDELLRTFKKEHDRLSFHFVKFDAADGSVEPTQAQIDGLLADDLPAVQARFEKDKLSYHTPLQVSARQIVLKLPRDASDAEVSAARAKLLSLKEQVEGGADFGALAKEHSEDAATASKGGDMGFVRRGQLARDLEQPLFSLKEGDFVPEPVRTPMGLHLAKVEKIKPPAAKEFAEVQDDVARKVLADRAGEAKAKGEAAALLASLKAGKSLEELTISEVESLDDSGKNLPKRLESPWVLRSQDSLPRIGVAPELHEALFALNTDAPLAGKVFQVGRAFYVVQLKEKEQPDLAKFAAEKERLREQAVWVKRNRVLEDWLTHLRGQAKVKLNPELFPATSAS